jgi:hypothetical protein
MLSMTAMLLWLGPRPELGDAVRSTPFWIKAGYTFLIGTAGLFAIERLGRPAATAGTSVAVVSATLAILAIAAAIEIAVAPSAARNALWWGNSYSACPLNILALSLPLLVAALVALKQLAPTRFTSAGAAAGLMAGGYGACIYSLHCTEYGLPFLATWYTLGVLLVVALGMLLSDFLHW